MIKQLLCLALATMGSTALFAQETTANAGKTTFGIRGGVNFQTLNGKDGNGNKLENDLLTGYHAGINVEIPVGPGFYLQPGLLYTVKGARYKATDSKVTISYLDIPVNLVYKPVLGTGNMLLGFGPYVGFGIGGKANFGNSERDVVFTNENDPGSGDPEYRRLDGGANLLAGYEFANKLSFQLNAQLGLLNILPERTTIPNDKGRLSNTGWGVSLGYRF